MKVGDLAIPNELINYYTNQGINELYPPQQESIEKGLLDNRNLVISIPTASGKTLIAELAMHSHILNGGKCLYVVPLRALASEKFREFAGKGVKVGISTGDFDKRDETLGRNDIIVATSEKVDSLLRNRAGWVKEISLLVIDEIHLIDDQSRGPTLEMVITKLRSTNIDMQILGLSATIGNTKELAGWLEADVVSSSWRPVELHEGVYFRGSIQFQEMSKEILTPTRHDDLNLCIDTISEGGQCLVFVNSRRNAEGFAKRCAKAIEIEDVERFRLINLSDELVAVAETEMGRLLVDCVKNGTAFHHAGMTHQQREIVERGFREREIKVISSTPTLAAGLNLPARRVIIRDYFRFQAGAGMIPIPAREYRQMAGRAGRPHLDPVGEAILIAKEYPVIDELFEQYIEAPPENVYSRIASESAICTHALSLFASKFSKNRIQLLEFMNKTYHSYQNPESLMLRLFIDDAIDYLSEKKMLEVVGEQLYPTEYGKLVSRLYIHPVSADKIKNALSSNESYTDIAILQILCSTCDMFNLYVGRNDYQYLDRFLYLSGDELWSEVPLYDDDEIIEIFYRSLKTSLMLLDWISEVPEDIICERYNTGPGDLYAATEAISWLIYAAKKISRMCASPFSEAIDDLEIRMKHGIKRELLGLVSLKGIGRIRARRLFNNGITSPEVIIRAKPDKIAALIGTKTAEMIIKQLSGRNIRITKKVKEKSIKSQYEERNMPEKQDTGKKQQYTLGDFTGNNDK